jgi:hypothetical protein
MKKMLATLMAYTVCAAGVSAQTFPTVPFIKNNAKNAIIL